MIDGYFRVKYSTGAIVCSAFGLLELNMHQARKIFNLALKYCDPYDLLWNAENLQNAVIQHKKQYEESTSKTKAAKKELEKAERLYAEFYSAARSALAF